MTTTTNKRILSAFIMGDGDHEEDGQHETSNKKTKSDAALKRQEEEGVGVEVGYFAASLAELTAGQPRVQVTLCREAEAAGLAVDAREAVPTFAHRTHVAFHAGPLQKTHEIQTTAI